MSHLEQKLKDLEDEKWNSWADIFADNNNVFSNVREESSADFSSVLAPVDSANPSAISLGESAGSSSQQSVSANEMSVDHTTATADGGDSLLSQSRRASSIDQGDDTGVPVSFILRKVCKELASFTLDSDSATVKLATALDAPLPATYFSRDQVARIAFLPQARVSYWFDLAFTQAFTLWPFIDQERLRDRLHWLLNQSSSGRASVDTDDLALIHAVIAIGQRHDANLKDHDASFFGLTESRG